VDVGKLQGADPGDTYALFHTSGLAMNGYLVLDVVRSNDSEGYLVRPENLQVPHDLSYVRNAQRLAELHLSRGQLELLGGRKSTALDAFMLADELTRGKDARVREQVQALEREGVKPVRGFPLPPPDPAAATADSPVPTEDSPVGASPANP
jgi:hypothetical protein